MRGLAESVGIAFAPQVNRGFRLLNGCSDQPPQQGQRRGTYTVSVAPYFVNS